MTAVILIAGFRLPAEHPLTAHEAAWIDALRSITSDRVPSPTLRMVQGLRGLVSAASDPVSPGGGCHTVSSAASVPVDTRKR